MATPCQGASLVYAHVRRRSCNEYTSMEDNHLCEIIWHFITEANSTMHSARVRERQLCTRQLEGITLMLSKSSRVGLTWCISIIGIGEIILLPLDVLKIKRQTNPEAFRGRGVFKIVADEGMGLYRGAGWTAARNAPGSFAVRINISRSEL